MGVTVEPGEPLDFPLAGTSSPSPLCRMKTLTATSLRVRICQALPDLAKNGPSPRERDQNVSADHGRGGMLCLIAWERQVDRRPKLFGGLATRVWRAVKVGDDHRDDRGPFMSEAPAVRYGTGQGLRPFLPEG